MRSKKLQKPQAEVLFFFLKHTLKYIFNKIAKKLERIMLKAAGNRGRKGNTSNTEEYW